MVDRKKPPVGKPPGNFPGRDFPDFIREQVTPEHRAQILAAANKLLQENARGHKEIGGRRSFLGGLIGGIAAAAVAVFVVFKPKTEEPGAGVSSDLLASVPLVEANIDLLADLDIIEDLEVLENWEPS